MHRAWTQRLLPRCRAISLSPRSSLPAQIPVENTHMSLASESCGSELTMASRPDWQTCAECILSREIALGTVTVAEDKTVLVGAGDEDPLPCVVATGCFLGPAGGRPGVSRTND